MSQSEASSAPNRADQSSRIFALIHRYRNLLRKRWWIPALTLTLALAAQGWRLWNTPPSYASYSRMVLNVRISNTGSPMAAAIEEGMSFYGTQIALMQSSTVLNRAADRVRSLHPETPQPAEPVILRATQIPRTSVFSVICTGLESNYTRFYLDAVMDEYLNVRRDMKTDTIGVALTAIQDKLGRLQKELTRGEEALVKFQSSNSVISLAEMGGGATKELVRLDSELNTLEIQYERLTKLTLDQNLQIQEGSVPDITSLDTSAERLAASGAGYLQLKRIIELKKSQQAEQSKIFRPKHPIMVLLNEEITNREKDLEILRQQSASRLEDTKVTLKANIDIIKNKIEQLKGNTAEISSKMAEYEKMKAENARNQLQFNQLITTQSSLELGRQADPETVKISERASEPQRVSLKLVRNLAIAAVVGLILGLGLLFVLDRLDDRPTSFTELQTMFDEPVLGQVPNEKPHSKNGETKLLQPGDLRHAFAEAYRNLRSSLLYMATEGKRAKTILVTSAVPNDGKSMTTANLAITLAQAGSSVLLIDADLRRGHLHKRLGVDATVGFTEVLTQNLPWEQAIKSTPIPNLTLLPRGSLCNSPGEYFLAQGTKDFLKTVAARYDYVVIDSAPVMAADDVGSLSPHVDGVVFVIRAGQTSARIAHAALDILYQREVNILGLVFNGVESAATEYYFYKYQNYAVYPGA
jgi:capsular exopolysaccharide synthesis family protein